MTFIVAESHKGASLFWKKHRKKKKKHLCRHDKNYYYFCKSDIPIINLIAVARNMIKLPKKISL